MTGGFLSRRTQRAVQPYLYVAPALIILAGLMLVPIVQVLRFSLYDNHVVVENPNFIGLDHFAWLVRNSLFWSVIGHTVLFTAVSVIGHLSIGLGIAVLLNKRQNSFAQAFFRTALILPWIFTAAVVAVNWRLLLAPNGLINALLRILGMLPEWIDWLGDRRFAMLTLILVNFWRGYPFVMISLLAGLQGIPQDLEEAAYVDGANKRQSFWRITFPLLAPVMYSIGLLDTIWTFRVFPLVWLLTGGGPGRTTEVLATYTYRYAFVDFEFGRASAVSVILLFFTIIFTIFYLRGQYRRSQS